MKKIKVIKKEAVVNIPMSTNFYARLLAHSINFAELHTKEEIQAVYDKIRTKTPLAGWEADYETLLTLCAEFEKQCQAGGFVTEVDEETAKEDLRALF